MPSTISSHRPSPSFDKLLTQLDENEVHLLLTELNNSHDVHVPVAEAVDFYEKPRGRRRWHPKRVASSPSLNSAHRDGNPRPLNHSPPPPLPSLPETIAPLPTREPLSPLPLTASRKKFDVNVVPPRSKRISSAPLMGAQHDMSTEDQPEWEETLPGQTIPATSRAYKRISRPLLSLHTTTEPQRQDLEVLLAVYLSERDDAAAMRKKSGPVLRSPRSMVHLEPHEDRYRPVDVLEPIVGGVGEPGPTSSLQGTLIRSMTNIDTFCTGLH